MEGLFDGAEKVVEGSDGVETALSGAALAVADADEDERGIDNAEGYALIMEFGSQLAIVPTGAQRSSWKTQVVVDYCIDVAPSWQGGQGGRRAHDFFRRAAASF